ncbi:hypothetical protein [Rhizorhabdus dicambivorans]|uniref:Uncharacterized protein n=1 Tax=Rhizorhabdus dicambivorans TaxID=1850238 RepID=A0A2A4G109_9SPHN|nr:hypothetical protein [Rhizorhabdus dicambivorans]ATE64894.1 hypothetical protein CMV14_11180 [Rhizorhabdus dicambivorans]PCE44169.1 hypothetical protein COO09_00565 [Rhizorhabdus dicambivorans]
MADESVEAAERRRRLRWLTLAEILGVSALVISALTLWNNYSERRQGEEARSAESRSASAKARTLVLRARVEKDGDRLALEPTGEQVIQGQTIAFPKALGVDPVDSTDPRIDARWFEDGLKAARKAAGETEKPRGDARLPVAITTRFTVDGEVAEDVTLYDIGYGTSSSFLGGTSIKLRGLSLIGRSPAEMAGARLDALWKARHKGSR